MSSIDARRGPRVRHRRAGPTGLHPRVEPRFHPRADAARGARGLSLAPCSRRAAGSCRSSPRCSASWSSRRRSQTDPQPALHGRGLLVLVALVAFVALLGFGVVCRTRHVDPRASWRLLAGDRRLRAGARASCSPTAPACSRSTSRSASPARGWSRGARSRCSPSAIVVVSALHELVARDGTLADTIIADASAIIFFFMGYMSRQFRLGQARAEQLRRGARGEPRGAGAGGRAARAPAPRARDARRARPLALRARRAARGRAAARAQHRRRPERGRRRRAQPPPRQGRAGGGAARDRGAARRRHARARPARRARRRSSASRPASRPRSRSTASRASCRPRRGWPSTARRRRR